MRPLLAIAAILLLSACAPASEATPTDSGPAFVFITSTPTVEANASPTEEPLPFRDLSSPAPTESPIPPSATPEPATATAIPAAAVVVQPTVAAIVVQPTAAVPPSVQPTQAPAPQVAASPAPTSVPPPAIAVAPVLDASSAEQVVIDLSNIYRTQSGLAPLLRDDGLMAIARSRSADMVARNYFGHYDPVTGLSLGKTQVLALGYGRAGENIYWSGRSLNEMAVQAVDWFMSDAPHRANILNSNYTAIGVGIVWNGQGWNLTQNFGGP